MGAFHEGHLSLMRQARRDCDVVVVSLFVNPAQFNDPADLERYPRDRERDEALAAELGAAGIEPDYFELVCTETLAPVTRIDGAVLAVLAAQLGGTRLIDNQLIQPSLNHDHEVATPSRAPTTA